MSVAVGSRHPTATRSRPPAPRPGGSEPSRATTGRHTHMPTTTRLQAPVDNDIAHPRSGTRRDTSHHTCVRVWPRRTSRVDNDNDNVYVHDTRKNAHRSSRSSAFVFRLGPAGNTTLDSEARATRNESSPRGRVVNQPRIEIDAKTPLAPSLPHFKTTPQVLYHQGLRLRGRKPTRLLRFATFCFRGGIAR